MTQTCPFQNGKTIQAEVEDNWKKVIPIQPHLKKSNYGLNKHLVLLSYLTPYHLIGAGILLSLFLPTLISIVLLIPFVIYPLIKLILNHFNYLPAPYAQDIIHQQYSAKCDGDFVVFLIGARANGMHPFTKRFADLGNAFQSMVKELESDPSFGYMSGDTYVSANDRKSKVVYIQYWRSYEALQKWTHTRLGIHVKAVAHYMKTDKDDGTYGIWHETYKVRDGEYESIYAHMPPMGLALATQIVPEPKHNNGPGRMQRREREKQKENCQ